jgi:hypothetical protein
VLTVRIINTGTGTAERANYRYRVDVNGRQIAGGELTGHNRADGWEALVSAIALQEKERQAEDEKKNV